MVLGLWMSALLGLAADTRYDPLKAIGQVGVERTEFTYDQREVPLKVYLPQQQPAPLILLSHGLGGSREVGAYLGEQWAGRGFVVVAMQHAGSDTAVWKGVAPAQRLAAMAKAVNRASFMGRMRDVPATLDQLELWNEREGHFLQGRIDFEWVGMAGHSYGAITTQALCGQRHPAVKRGFVDERIDAGLALSPSPPAFGDADRAFGAITRPMMLMTGTDDGSVIGKTTPEGRRDVYAAMPAGSKYELVLDGADHLAFGDLPPRGARARDHRYHRVIKGLSTAFWDAYLGQDATARSWLDHGQPRAMLEAKDLWQCK